MRFDNIIIEDGIKEKILSKHQVEANEIKRVLLNKPFVLKSKYNRYIAIGHHQRYTTIIFEHKNNMTIYYNSLSIFSISNKVI